MKKFCWLLVLCGASVSSHAQVQIQDLDRYLHPGLPEQQVLQARRDASQEQVRQREAEAGWQVFGQVSSGRTREIAAANQGATIRKYTANTLGGGLTYPLLGARDKHLQNIASAELDAKINELRVSQYQREQLRLLRLAWLNAWAAQQKLKLAEEILAEEARADKLLKNRQKAGLLLESDRLEALNLFSLTRRVQTDAQRTLKESALQIRRLSTLSLPENSSENLTRPDLAQTQVPDGFSDALSTYHASVEGARSMLSLADGWGGVDAQFQLSANVGRESWAPDINSSGAYAALSVNFPAGIGTWRDARSQEFQARLVEQEQSLAVEKDRRSQLQLALEGEIVRARADVDVHAHQQQQAQARLREKSLRLKSLTGDVYEQWLKAYTDVNIIRFESLNSWQRLQTAQIELASLTGTRLVGAGKAGGEQLAPDTGFYLWDVTPLLTAPQAQLDALERAGARRVLISMNSRQLQDPQLEQKLGQLVQQAQARGLRVEWLLGDISWIQPARHADLLTLLQRFAAVPFNGLHLDLEVEQDPRWQGEPERVKKEWVETLVTVAAHSRLPVGVSMHPRHIADTGLMDELQTSGVQEVVLMSYVTQWQKQVQLMNRARKALPRMRVTLALSIEQNQPGETSYHQLSRLKSDYGSLVKQLDFAPPLLIQSWEDWKRSP